MRRENGVGRAMTADAVAVAPHGRRATPVGVDTLGAREWYGALSLPWGTEVVAGSAAVERHVDVARDGWTRPSSGAQDLRPLRGSTPLLVETRAPVTVWVDGLGLVPWGTTTDVVAWAVLLEWSPLRGQWPLRRADERVATAWELAHRTARWELMARVYACSGAGAVRDAGAFVSCIEANGCAVPVGESLVVPCGREPMPFDGRGFLAAALAVVSTVNRGAAVLRRSGRAGWARRFDVILPSVGRPHPENAATRG